MYDLQGKAISLDQSDEKVFPGVVENNLLLDTQISFR